MQGRKGGEENKLGWAGPHSLEVNYRLDEWPAGGRLRVIIMPTRAYPTGLSSRLIVVITRV